jgi:hypothetical protein
LTKSARVVFPSFQIAGGKPMWALLLLPFVGLLWVPFYNVRGPELLGFPFFYWYQLAWVPITAGLTWLVYRDTLRREDGSAR